MNPRVSAFNGSAARKVPNLVVASPQYQRPRPCQPMPTKTIAAVIMMINAVAGMEQTKPVSLCGPFQRRVE
jgi:hypothetical protein